MNQNRNYQGGEGGKVHVWVVHTRYIKLDLPATSFQHTQGLLPQFLHLRDQEKCLESELIFKITKKKFEITMRSVLCFNVK